METKTTGISRDLIIHPGETIADILDERNITKAELAVRTGVSASFISSIIAGKKAISSKFAMSLEYALGVPKTFWLNLQAKYDAEILEFEAENSISDEEVTVYKQLKDVINHLVSRKLITADSSVKNTILDLRRIFKISNLCNLKKVPLASAFRMSSKDKTNPCVLGAWIRMCQIHENNLGNNVFDPANIDNLINELKNIMLSDTDNFSKEIKTVLYKYGLDFEIVHHFRGAPVQGFLYKRADNEIKICMTIRKSFADIFWFSLFHELGHLYNGDLSRSSQFLDDGVDKEKEEAANRFASDKLINKSEYDRFVSQYCLSPSYELIEKFSLQQRVKPFIVVGRMQKERIIGYQHYSFAKTRYKWAE